MIPSHHLPDPSPEVSGKQQTSSCFFHRCPAPYPGGKKKQQEQATPWPQTRKIHVCRHMKITQKSTKMLTGPVNKTKPLKEKGFFRCKVLLGRSTSQIWGQLKFQWCSRAHLVAQNLPVVGRKGIYCASSQNMYLQSSYLSQTPSLQRSFCNLNPATASPPPSKVVTTFTARYKN